MTTYTYVDPQPSGGTFPTLAADDIRVMSRIAAAFAAHETLNGGMTSMTVTVDAGALFIGGTLTEVAQQTSGTITAPTTNPRIDRVVIDRTTGALQIVTGTEAASPVAPAVPSGTLPIARIALATSTTAITNALITDERISPSASGGSVGRGLLNVQRFTSSGTYTPTAGTTMVIVEAIGGGAGGGGTKATGAGQVAVGGGGGAGSYGRGMYTSGFSGVTVTVAAGVAAAAAGADGTDGNSSSFGSLLTVPGGKGGTAGNAVTPPTITWGSNAGALPTGANIIEGSGSSGFIGMALSSTVMFGGRGAQSVFSMGSSGNFPGPAAGGGNSTFNGGAGGSGATSTASNAARAGGPGQAGLVIVYEYA